MKGINSNQVIETIVLQGGNVGKRTSDELAKILKRESPNSLLHLVLKDVKINHDSVKKSILLAL